MSIRVFLWLTFHRSSKWGIREGVVVYFQYNYEYELACDYELSRTRPEVRFRSGGICWPTSSPNPCRQGTRRGGRSLQGQQTQRLRKVVDVAWLLPLKRKIVPFPSGSLWLGCIEVMCGILES